MVVPQGRSPLLLPHSCPRKSPREAASVGAELKSSFSQSWNGGHRSGTIAQAPFWVFLKGLFFLRGERARAARGCRISTGLHGLWSCTWCGHLWAARSWSGVGEKQMSWETPSGHQRLWSWSQQASSLLGSASPWPWFGLWDHRVPTAAGKDERMELL